MDTPHTLHQLIIWRLNTHGPSLFDIIHPDNCLSTIPCPIQTLLEDGRVDQHVTGLILEEAGRYLVRYQYISPGTPATIAIVEKLRAYKQPLYPTEIFDMPLLP